MSNFCLRLQCLGPNKARASAQPTTESNATSENGNLSTRLRGLRPTTTVVWWPSRPVLLSFTLLLHDETPEDIAARTNDVFAVRSTEGGTVCALSNLLPGPHNDSIRRHPCSHKSVLEYLNANNFTDAFNALKADTALEYSPDPKSKYSGLLEKKWTSVIRLQKKVRPVLTTVRIYAP